MYDSGSEELGLGLGLLGMRKKLSGLGLCMSVPEFNKEENIISRRHDVISIVFTPTLLVPGSQFLFFLNKKVNCPVSSLLL